MIKFFRKTHMSLRGGTTWQSLECAMSSNNTLLLRIEIIQALNWNRGSVRRLPRRASSQ